MRQRAASTATGREKEINSIHSRNGSPKHRFDLFDKTAHLVDFADLFDKSAHLHDFADLWICLILHDFVDLFVPPIFVFAVSIRRKLW